MNENSINIKKLFIYGLMSLAVLIVLIIIETGVRQTRIVFCDVGQGNATYIRTLHKVDILIDAGPNRSVLSCLGKYMPFFDKNLELVIITHPDLDHYGGLNYILDRYNIEKLIINNIDKDDAALKKLHKKLLNKQIDIESCFSGDKIHLRDDVFYFYWPPKDFYSSDDNDLSSVFYFQEKSFRLLFTGDTTPYVLNRLTDQNIGKVDIMEIPHHGSKYGLTGQFLKLADPKMVVISVGKNNPYGHPDKKILDIIEALKIKIKRTDKEGNIVVQPRRLTGG